MSQPTPKPFLKWAGGKTVLLPEILPRLPKRIGTYFEPFLGGGAVFFALANERRFDHAELFDANVELMRTYKALQEDPFPVVALLEEFAREHREVFYYAVRAQEPSKRKECAARFIYLNRTCFNGLYRVNRSGKFNVPMGEYANPKILDKQNLLAVHDALEKVRLLSCDFGEVFYSAGPGDAVYFDPPYVPFNRTSNFTAYSAGGFGEADHTRLRDLFLELDSRGVHVLLSNSDTPFVRELYKGFKIEEVSAPRRVNSKGNKRGNVTELLISGRNAS